MNLKHIFCNNGEEHISGLAEFDYLQIVKLLVCVFLVLIKIMLQGAVLFLRMKKILNKKKMASLDHTIATGNPCHG